MAAHDHVADLTKLVAYLGVAGEHGDPTEANALYGAPSITLDAWCRMPSDARGGMPHGPRRDLMNPHAQFHRDLARLLRRDVAAEDLEGLVADLEGLERRLSNLTIDASFPADAVDRGRRAGSTTLVEPDEQAMRGWREANTQLTAWLAEEAPFDLAKVSRLNGLLLGHEGASPWRSEPCFFSGYRAPDPTSLPDLMEGFAETVLARGEHLHPIAGAALAQQWLSSVHPYADGNGRTARLAADWVLSRAGWLPPTYGGPIEATNALVPRDGPALGVAASIRILMAGISRTVDLLGA